MIALMAPIGVMISLIEENNDSSDGTEWCDGITS